MTSERVSLFSTRQKKNNRNSVCLPIQSRMFYQLDNAILTVLADMITYSRILLIKLLISDKAEQCLPNMTLAKVTLRVRVRKKYLECKTRICYIIKRITRLKWTWVDLPMEEDRKNSWNRE